MEAHVTFQAQGQHWPRSRGRNYLGPSLRTGAFSLVGLKAAQRTEAGPVVVELRLKWNRRARSTETDIHAHLWARNIR